MISETMPLNEWPSDYLKHLDLDLEAAKQRWDNEDINSTHTKTIISVVKQAIKDAEEREAKLPFE